MGEERTHAGTRLKRWWKSPRMRALRHRVSDLQIVVHPVIRMLVRLWCWCIHHGVRCERRGPLFEFIRERRPCIVALWHQDPFPLMFELFRDTPSYPSYFMVSHGRLGTIGTSLLNIWGIEVVRGSRAGRGWQAVEELTGRALQDGRSVFIMADGSRGPPRQAKWGAIQLARDTGLPIIAAHAWGNNLVVLERTWMRLVLPKPWGRAVVFSGEPLHVPASARERADLDVYRLELERRLNALVAEGEAEFAGHAGGAG